MGINESLWFNPDKILSGGIEEGFIRLLCIRKRQRKLEWEHFYAYLH
jgi:hypothetical protein